MPRCQTLRTSGPVPARSSRRVRTEALVRSNLGRGFCCNRGSRNSFTGSLQRKFWWSNPFVQPPHPAKTSCPPLPERTLMARRCQNSGHSASRVRKRPPSSWPATVAAWGWRGPAFLTSPTLQPQTNYAQSAGARDRCCHQPAE